MSSLRMRAFGPDPVSFDTSTPSSRAKRRTPGLACGGAPDDGSAAGAMGAGVGALFAAGGGAAAGTCAGAGAAAEAAGAALPGAGAAAGAAFAAEASDSMVTMGTPSLTLSPTFTRMLFTVPEEGAGTSIVALSLSSVTSESSFFTVSPGFTRTSITGTSLKSPISGTFTSIAANSLLLFFVVLAARSDRPGRGLLRVDAVLPDRLGDLGGGQLAILGEGLQRGDRHVEAVHLEEAAQVLARVAAPEAVGAEHLVAARHELADLVGEGAHVVGGRDHRPAGPGEALLHVRGARLLRRVQQVPARASDAVAAQLVEAGAAPYVGEHSPILLQELACGHHLAQDRAAAEELHARARRRAGVGELVHALEDALARALGKAGVRVVLVHEGDVVENVLLVFHHAAQTVLHDHRDLVGKGGIVGNAVGNHRRHDEAMAILVLQALAVQRGAPRGAAHEEAARAQVPRGPHQVANALHAEHRIEDEERDHRHVVVGVRRRRRHPGAHGTGLVDAFLEDLAVLVLLVEHQLVAVFRLVELAHLRVDAELAEQTLHAEGARLVGHLLLLVGDVLAFAHGAHAVALHGLREDYRGLALVLHRRRVRRVHLVRIVAAAVQAPHVRVGHVGHHRPELRVLAEEMLAHIGAVAALELLVLAVDRLFHALQQEARLVAGDERIPIGAPDHLDHVPAGATEIGLELLDDLAVAAHRAVEALQVAVHHEDEVVEVLARRHADRAERFGLIHLAVAHEGPYLALGRLRVAAILQVVEEACLVDRLDRAQAHGHRRELPEVGHEPRMGVGRDALAIHFLAEVVELRLGQAALEERARVA